MPTYWVLAEYFNGYDENHNEGCHIEGLYATKKAAVKALIALVKKDFDGEVHRDHLVDLFRDRWIWIMNDVPEWEHVVEFIKRDVKYDEKIYAEFEGLSIVSYKIVPKKLFK